MDLEKGVEDSPPELQIQLTNSGSICNCIISCLTLASLAFIVFQCRDYLKLVLLWIEDQDPLVIYLIFIALFALVSFPFTWGYIFLNLACGYLFGILRGILAVVITATLGITIAHFIIRNYLAEFALNRLFNSENARALLQVISGPQAFKVIFFARLTPIPFGLQNTIFAVSLKGKLSLF
jgi:protein maelstrom